jgi:formate hydrogenlyase subunit 6/NADH:ubiquinone oxidoreductase subunit I
MKITVIGQLLKNLVTKPMTVKFPYEAIPIPEGYRGEHVLDIEKCTSCTLCAMICPNRAIEMVEAPPEYKATYPKKYPRIDLGKCCFCGLCQDICPQGGLTLSKNFFLSTFDVSTTIKAPFPLQPAQSAE